MFTRRKFPLHLGSYLLASGVAYTIGRNSPHCLRILPHLRVDHLSMLKHLQVLELAISPDGAGGQRGDDEHPSALAEGHPERMMILIY